MILNDDEKSSLVAAFGPGCHVCRFHQLNVNNGDLYCPYMSTGWREFDDSKVREMSESCITTKAAYVLFYQRRPPPVTSSVSVSSTSVDTGIPAPMPSSAHEAASVPQATAVQQAADSEGTSSANRKTVTPPAPPAAAEFDAPVWQTDIEAMD